MIILIRMTTSELVLRQDDAGVTTLTLNNPERRNAWSRAMEERYFALLDDVDADPDVRVVVVTGSGTTFAWHSAGYAASRCSPGRGCSRRPP